MKNDIATDLLLIKELRNYSDDKLSEGMGISRMTLNRWMKNDLPISETNLEKIYDFAFKNGIRLNKIKEQLFKEDYYKEGSIVLYHGAKTKILGELSLEYSKRENDFGRGFYCGESFEQSAMFVSGYPNSSLCICSFKTSENLKRITFDVDRDWMLAIAYYREKLIEYKDCFVIKKLVKSIESADYIIAPIADNRMFQIIDSFIDGIITDVQCLHALSATNLGKQYVFVSEKALANVKILHKCYLSDSEKEYYSKQKNEETILGNDKVKLAMRKYRGQGQYIDEILK